MTDELDEPVVRPVRRGGREQPRRNVADPEAVAATAKAIAETEDRVQSDLRHLLAQPEFRRYVWRWLDKLKMYSDAIPLNSELYVQAAEKRVALRMWREVEDVDPTALLQMMQDARAKEL